MNDFKERIFLSPPHMGGEELQFVHEAFASNYIAPLGPQVDAFEQEFAEKVGAKYALALSSGTAAIHLALIHLRVRPGDEVIVSDLTFAASANPVIYLGARPVFIDSERLSWNMDPNLLAETLTRKARQNKLPKAVILVHLYGQCADLDSILAICNEYDIPLIEDAAEALGATYKGRAPGTFGKTGIFSFNGNKIITTSGGGMLVSDDRDLIAHCRHLSTQARDPAPHYEHSEIGYNYRMSNILAAIGRGQLQILDERVRRKREIFAIYRRELSSLPGMDFMPETPWGMHNRWLTVISVDKKKFGKGPESIRINLEKLGIEARPVWKPMHMQKVFHDCMVKGGRVAEQLFATGLCLPSGTSLAESELGQIVDNIKKMPVR